MRSLTNLFLALLLALLVAASAAAQAAPRQAIRGRCSRDYAVRATLRLVRPANAQASFYLNDLGPGGHYRVDLSTTAVTIVKVEAGLETALGSPSRRGLRATPAEPSAPGTEVPILILRRGPELAVFVDWELAARAEDEALTQGRAYFASADGSVTLARSRLQRVGDVHAADDFVKTTEEKGAWARETGDWKIKALPNPSLSANAFFSIGKSEAEHPAIQVTGHWFWYDYQVSAACRGQASGALGLVFYYRDPKNYYAFRWQPEREGKPAVRELVAVRDGVRQVVKRQDGGFEPGQWYRLKVLVQRQRVQAFIDGRPVLEAEVPGLAAGKAGLYSEDEEGVLFDDFYLARVHSFADDFAQEVRGRWLPLGGEWQIANGQFIGTSDRPAKAVAGSLRWKDYTFSARVVGRAGICFGYQDELNYGRFLFQKSGDARLEQVINGKPKLLGALRGVLHVYDSALPRLTVSVRGGLIRASGSGVIEAWAPALARGKIGLMVDEGRAIFDDVQVTFPEPPRPILSINNVFPDEMSMRAWAAAASDWRRIAETRNGKPLNFFWHRADFPGDTAITVRFPNPPEAGGELWMVLNATSEDSTTGYALEVRSLADRAEFILFRQGKELTRGVAGALQVEDRVSFQRQGGSLLARLGNRMVLAVHDPAPLTGRRVARATERFSLQQGKKFHEFVEVFSDHVLSYPFALAPVDWRIGSGDWEVTSRWSCDPRWAWFSGESRAAAVIWNKYSFRGDLTVEFCAAIRMGAGGGGRGYRASRDINLTICADGKSLTSGYSFVFGGWKNSVTRLLRRDEVVRETKKVLIPVRRNIHRQWFYFRIEKRGRSLRYFVDGEKLFEYEDPEPLPGRHLALWTYRDAIMISRVRISSDGREAKTSPDWRGPDDPPTCYTKKPPTPAAPPAAPAAPPATPAAPPATPAAPPAAPPKG